LCAVTTRGVNHSGTLFLDPRAVLFAEMENSIVGGAVTIGWQENGDPLEIKVDSSTFEELCKLLRGR
jgi:hypothetical protein